VGCTFLWQTGPKGVINDWRRFKQLETEKKAEQDIERLELINKLSLTCRTEVSAHHFILHSLVYYYMIAE
jgi:hypothetical protein